jgi:hypothetical protein
MDAAGNLFGVCYEGGAYGDGWIFELTNCSQACILVDLHDFSGNDGSLPWGAPVLDTHGNLYGTTSDGGTGAATLAAAWFGRLRRKADLHCSDERQSTRRSMPNLWRSTGKALLSGKWSFAVRVAPGTKDSRQRGNRQGKEDGPN